MNELESIIAPLELVAAIWTIREIRGLECLADRDGAFLSAARQQCKKGNFRYPLALFFFNSNVSDLLADQPDSDIATDLRIDHAGRI